jgi:hypothetical protein
MPVHDGPSLFYEAGEFDQTYRGLDTTVGEPEIQAIALTFMASLDRIRHLHDLPIQLIAWADHLSTCHAKIRAEYGLAADDVSQDKNLIYGERVTQAFIEGRGKRDPRDFGATRLEGMLSWEAKNSRGSDGSASTGTQALFAAMVMGAYAALETLAADLWVVAVNKRDSLATNWIKKNEGKSFSTATFLGHGFDLSGRMGTVLHDTRRVSFESWNDVRTAYAYAFAGAMDDAFNPLQDVYLAEKTRHLFAHRGGLVDKKFLGEMKDFSEFSGTVVGERLRLTGPILKARADACIKCGADLLVGVDQWILKNA